MWQAVVDLVVEKVYKETVEKVVTDKAVELIGKETAEKAIKVANAVKKGKKIYNTAKKIYNFKPEKIVNRLDNKINEAIQPDNIVKRGVEIARDTKSKAEARKIIEQGMRDIQALEDVTVDDDGTRARREVRLKDVKKAIADFPERKRYTKKQLETLRKNFNFNRLKSHTNIYVDFNVERVLVPGKDQIMDTEFTHTIRVGTLAQSPETRVRNLGRELNKQFASFAAMSESTQDQLGSLLNRLPDRLIKDPSDPSKGIAVSRLTEDDVDTMLNALKNTSELAELPFNFEARDALEDWQADMGDAEYGRYKSDLAREPVQIPWYNSKFPIQFSTLYDAMERMIVNLDYNSDEERFTHQSYYEFVKNAISESGNESIKTKFMRELFMLFATNHPISPNIRGTQLDSHGYPMGGPDAKPGEMPHLIDQKKYEMIAGLKTAYADKLAGFKRG